MTMALDVVASLAKYGGIIFRVSYVVAGVQTTLIEYLSTSKLGAQLADTN